MQNWLTGLFSAVNSVAVTFRRAENVMGEAAGEGRSVARYVIMSVAGLAVIGTIVAGAFYFWGSSSVAVDQSAVSEAATPKTADQQTRTQISYVDGISLEADVAARSVAVTSSFRGAEIILFGAVDDTKYTATANRPFDVVIAIEGREEPVVMRKKSNVAGMWINTQSVRFNNVPSFYAVQSTRPLAEIADSDLYRKHKIGIANILGLPVSDGSMSAEELKPFADALRRLKQEGGLYVEDDDSVSFTGRVLFRSTIDLPPSVLVGTLIARVYLLRDGELLANFTSDIRMERQGLMRYMHQLAFTYQLFYGILAVLLAAAAGIGASMLFRKSGH